jgi:hypothetical protein
MDQEPHPYADGSGTDDVPTEAQRPRSANRLAANNKKVDVSALGGQSSVHLGDASR